MVAHAAATAGSATPLASITMGADGWGRAASQAAAPPPPRGRRGRGTRRLSAQLRRASLRRTTSRGKHACSHRTAWKRRTRRTLRPPRVVWCPWDRVRDRGVRSRRWTARRCPCHGPRDLRGRNRAAVPRRICASTMNMCVRACLLVCVHDTARRPDARAPVVLLTLTGLPPRQRWRCVFV